MKFKIGQRVRTTTDPSSPNNLCERPKGYNFIIVEEWNGWYRGEKGRSTGVRESDLELIENQTEEPKFKVGDRVRLREGVECSSETRFTGEGIFRGDSPDWDYCVAIERLDKIPGNAQNNWWNFRKEDLVLLEKIEPEKEEPKGVDLQDGYCAECDKKICTCEQRNPDCTWSDQPKTTNEKFTVTIPPDTYRLDFNRDMINIDYFKPLQLYYNAQHEPKKKGIIMSAVDFIKKSTLKVTNPDEYELREAGLHDSDGDITEQGRELQEMYVEELVKDKMIAAAKDINAAKEKK